MSEPIEPEKMIHCPNCGVPEEDADAREKAVNGWYSVNITKTGLWTPEKGFAIEFHCTRCNHDWETQVKNSDEEEGEI